tara:strand:+ start:11 stop:1081 length:1071 start_codon:yes stop_codon:yes gene_type:complete
MKINTYLKAIILKFISNKKYLEFDVKLSTKVLMLRYDRIGDMILTTPVFRELKAAYPNIEINVLASKANFLILKNNPNVDNVYLNNKNNLFFDLPLLFKLRKQKIDTCIEFDHSVIRHAILRLKIINPKKIISVKKNGRYGLKGNELKLYDFYTEKKENAHFRDIWLETLRPFQVIPKHNSYEIFCDEKDQDQAFKFLKKFSNKLLVGINLKGAVKGKKIRFSELKEICKGLYKLHNNIQIIILFSPAEEEEIKYKISNLNLAYVAKSYKTNTINSVSALIENLDIIITPDTSITHIASTFNKPVISIHEKNEESHKLFAPTSDLNRTIFSNSNNSLEGFSVAAVINATDDLIKLM